MNQTKIPSVHKSSLLILMMIQIQSQKMKLKVSESTQAGSIVNHIRSKMIKNPGSSIFIWIKHKDSVYPLQLDLTAKYLAQNYKQSDDHVHLLVKTEDAFGANYLKYQQINLPIQFAQIK